MSAAHLRRVYYARDGRAFVCAILQCYIPFRTLAELDFCLKIDGLLHLHLPTYLPIYLMNPRVTDGLMGGSEGSIGGVTHFVEYVDRLLETRGMMLGK